MLKNKSEALKQIHAYLLDESKDIGDNGKEYNILGCDVVDCEGGNIKTHSAKFVRCCRG